MMKVESIDNMASHKPKGRNAGKLMLMMSVPMDVFYEIVSHMEPKDLLQLSRASKELRALLLSKKDTRRLWVAARNNVVPPLPDCPEDMSEPRYAFLVFERFCELCGQGRAQNVDYAIRVRLCGGCWTAEAQKGSELCKTLQLQRQKELQEILCTLVPRGTRSWSSSEWHDGPLKSLDQMRHHWYYSPQFLSVAREYLALRRSGNQTALQDFVEKRQADTLVRRNFHRTLLDWEVKSGNIKYAAGADAQAERISEITNELRELGYDPTEFPRRNTDWDQMLNQPRKLTPRIWNTIRPKLVVILEEGRRQREADAFQLKWAKRREQLQAHYKQFLLEDRASIKTRTLPSPHDAVELPCMKDIMTGEEPHVDLTQENFLTIRDTMLFEAEEYRARVQRELAKKLADASAARPVASSTLPPRKRRRLPGAKLVAKGKQRASAADDSDDAGMDSDEVSKLLESPSSVFRCSPGWLNPDKCNSQVVMSYIGLLEHRQAKHGTWNNDDIFVTKPGYGDLFDAQFARRLLSSLRLEEGTTHSELDVIVHSGRPQCSCRKDPIPNFESEPKPAIFGRLVRLFSS
ncbi:hypothetical protein OH76DRAFT_1433438 [Lentinus brumalis]|uniref:F-box domain-containing protein n=1 Tax=Lentinus brumalis TaxID=2498619 RepID=A0A371DJH6_9APHY|nr:hypothetical protein OH76DRAFT_1433438 [Polyporus brumalis]